MLATVLTPQCAVSALTKASMVIPDGLKPVVAQEVVVVAAIARAVSPRARAQVTVAGSASQNLRRRVWPPQPAGALMVCTT